MNPKLRPCLCGCVILLGLIHNLSAASGDENWDSRFGAPCDKNVYALAVSGSSVYVGGYFTTIGGIAANRVAKWDGNTWSALGSGIGGNGVVYAMAVAENGLYVAGTFTDAGGEAVQNVAKWDGSGWHAVGTNAPEASSIAVRGGEVYISHSSSSPAVGPYVAKWNGTNWVSLGGGVTATTARESLPVRSIVAHSDGVYIGGMFTQLGGSVAATNIARWDGSQWRGVGGGLQYTVPYSVTNFVVTSLLSSGNNLYACGKFTRAGGQSITNLARWDGLSWSAVGNNYWGQLNAVAVSKSAVYAGGSLDPYIDGVTKGVTKWDGTAWSPLGSGIIGTVYALAATDTELYVGGRFTLAGGRASTNFAVWHDMPGLQAELLTASMRVSWPTQFSGLVLEVSTNLLPASWGTAPQTPGIYNSRYAITNRFPKKAEFYRLRRP